MDFLKWWWWNVLDEDNRENIVAWFSVFATVVAVIIIVIAHMWLYPWIFCVDWFLGVIVSSGWSYWYFSKQHKAYLEKDEEEEKS